MAIAIRIDATKTRLKNLVDKYTSEGLPAIRVTCPEPECRQEYIVYHGPTLGEAQLREGLAPYLTRDHPKHPVLYEIHEAQADVKNLGMVEARALYQRLQLASVKVGDVDDRASHLLHTLGYGSVCRQPDEG